MNGGLRLPRRYAPRNDNVGGAVKRSRRPEHEVRRSTLGVHAVTLRGCGCGRRHGDVRERCLWQKKRAIRSGSGRNSASEGERRISGTATGCAPTDLKLSAKQIHPSFTIHHSSFTKTGDHRSTQRGCGCGRRHGCAPTGCVVGGAHWRKTK